MNRHCSQCHEQNLYRAVQLCSATIIPKITLWVTRYGFRTRAISQGAQELSGVVSKTFAFTFLKRVFLVTHVKTHNCLHDLSPMMHTQARFKHIDLFYLSFATLMIVSIL